ncbi:AraC family transcriptional regulator [Rhizobium sp. TRM95111]|uniref:AraC family transcriptional regulator n=1 Tax=Rhizobium alarense TaxID=2846851 RepID=UPI001F42B604|nr:AraC family transcriptional regulator [Rhizobium alarense]MCF3642311.1 AraC family transcriptional regulator [Rhizobium alarense]
MDEHSGKAAGDGRPTGNVLAGAVGDDLEGSCGGDRIRLAPASGGIERIEARFTGRGFEPHRHDTYAIGMTLSGVQTFAYRGRRHASLPGNVIVLHPDELHDGGAGTEDGLTYRMMYVPPERLVAAMPSGAALPFVQTPVFEDARFAAFLRGALADIDHAADPLQLDDMLVETLAGLTRHAGAPVPAPGKAAPDAVARACAFLRENLERTVHSEELEAETGLDRFALARQFRRVVGTSPHRYLVMRRLERAKTMMRDGAALAETAAATGFADQAHFSRHFKATFGMTPGRWLTLSAA